MPLQRGLHGRRKAVPVDGERAAGGNLVDVGRAHDQRIQPAHLLVQQADRVVAGVVGAEGIGADELGAAVGHVRFGRAHRAHLVQNHAHAALRELPGGFGAGEARANDVHASEGEDLRPASCADR